jgi:hypothetical protein
VKERSVPIRPGILEHLLRGDISAFEFGIYVIVHLQVTYSTGIWRGSAPRILNSAPRGARLREIQRALEHLTQLGLLKHFHKHGQRGNFPFLINKFTVRCGALKGMRLNAEKSQSWHCPVYEPCADGDTDVRTHDAPIQEVRGKKKEQRQNLAAKTTPPPDVRFQLIIDAYYQNMRNTGIEPSCDQSDFGRLRSWLKVNPNRSLESVLGSLRHACDSTDPYPLKPGFRLREFLQHEAKYQCGPLLKGCGPKPVQPLHHASMPRNDLSPAGEQKLQEYGVAR